MPTNSSNVSLLYGLILAGGKSSRMGFDKALLDFHGVPQVVWLSQLISQFCDKVFVSGTPFKSPDDFHFIEDRYDHGGPMNGILSAFQIHPKNSWLVVPVDMPNLNEEAIKFLLFHRDKNFSSTGFKSKDGYAEPLPVLLEPAAFPILLNRFNEGKDSLSQFLKENKSNLAHVPDSSWLKNVNYPSQI